VDPSTLGNIDTPERLENPINTTTRSHDDWHKRMHKVRSTFPRKGHIGPRDILVDGLVGLDGNVGSMEGEQ